MLSDDTDILVNFLATTVSQFFLFSCLYWGGGFCFVVLFCFFKSCLKLFQDTLGLSLGLIASFHLYIA